MQVVPTFGLQWALVISLLGPNVLGGPMRDANGDSRSGECAPNVGSRFWSRFAARVAEGRYLRKLGKPPLFHHAKPAFPRFWAAQTGQSKGRSIALASRRSATSTTVRSWSTWTTSIESRPRCASSLNSARRTVTPTSAAHPVRVAESGQSAIGK